MADHFVAMARDLLDLHGCRVEEVWPKIDRFLREAELHGLKQGCIMTGKGTGKVRDQALKALKLEGYPHKPEKLPEKLKDGRVNDGVWTVYL